MHSHIATPWNNAVPAGSRVRPSLQEHPDIKGIFLHWYALVTGALVPIPNGWPPLPDEPRTPEEIVNTSKKWLQAHA